ncbi:replication associated protein [Papio cynocephalus associated smacovirus]|uniref:Replication associated protein n=1 Tax=Papio cynocephalus associated smacovirus TaxID=2213168 RepID=A0A455R569_9VIRU|nr:replication associated protein [Papio cynocephalus associated smacovirus]BBE29378.1 replication associated protein [Papio cynocephalus associated smacovirus]
MTAPTWWDCTVPNNEKHPEIQMREILDKTTERYAYGREIGGETGYQHFQLRCVFKKPMTENEVRNLMPGCHWTPTKVRNFEYVEKEGDFYRSWEGALAKYQDFKPYLWQELLAEMVKNADERRVDVIVDRVGGRGKTSCAKWLQVTKRAQYVPPMQSAQDLMAFAMAKPSKAYVIDMPKACNIVKTKELWNGIEQLKNGYVYDKRYQYKDKWIEPPAIVVITNETPQQRYLSADRWNVQELLGTKPENLYYMPIDMDNDPDAHIKDKDLEE